MAISVVQSTGAVIYSSNPASLAYGSNNTAGNCLVVMGWVNNSGSGTISISDTQSNTWGSSPDYTILSNNGNSQDFVFILFNCKAGANTVTVSDSATALLCISAIFEISGVAQKDQENQGTGSSSPGYSSSTITPTQANSIVLVAFQSDNCQPASVNSPFTKVGGGASNVAYGCGAYNILSSAASTFAVFTTDINSSTSCGDIIFDLIASTVTSPLPPLLPDQHYNPYPHTLVRM